MKRFAAILMMLCFAASSLYAAGTVTTPTRDDDKIVDRLTWDKKLIRTITWSWTSTDGSPDASGGTVRGLWGKILCIWGHSINDSADDNYDVQLLNQYAMDVLDGYGLNMPQDDSDEDSRVVPLDANGAHCYLFGDNVYFSGTNLNSANDASGDFHMMYEVWE